MKRLFHLNNLLLVTITIISISCKGQKNAISGYRNLDTLYSDFVRYLIIGGDDLKKYCFKITPDEETVSYMEKSNVTYRGIPDELKKQKIKVSLIGEKYFEIVENFREGLLKDKQLDSLVYIGRENQGEELFDKRLNVYATETFIIMKSGNDTIRCKLGEMFNFGSHWKSFTSPKLGW